MTFNKSVLPLGDGNATHARESDGGTIEIFCAVDGGVVLKKVDIASRTVKTDSVISYADACFFCGDGFLEKSVGGFAFAEFRQ